MILMPLASHDPHRPLSGSVHWPLSLWHEFKETGLALLIAIFPLHFSRPVSESVQRLPQRIDTPMHFAALIPSRIAKNIELLENRTRFARVLRKGISGCSWLPSKGDNRNRDRKRN
jgi:hypothetical protein